MDELDMIRTFRREVPAGHKRARAAAHVALLAHIEGEFPHALRRKRTIPWQRLIPAAMAAAALALACFLVVGPLLTGGQSASASAARALRAAAHVAATQQPLILRAGEYAYTRSEGEYFDQQDRQGKTWGALVRTTREIWIGLDGSGRIREHSNVPQFPGPGDRARWVAAGSPPITELSGLSSWDQHFGAGRLAAPLNVDGLHRDQLLSLAGNPDALDSAIRALAEQNPNPLSWEMLTIVGDLLGETAAPPELRASLYQVAATIPGVELVGTVRDRHGRTGTAVAASRDYLRLELIFDPATSELLAQEQTLRQRVDWIDAPAGTPIAYTEYLQSGVTSSTAAVP